MITFRQKEFGKKILNIIKDNPLATASLGVSTASLGIAGANLGINTKRQKEAKDISNKQLDMMKKQMDVIERNTKAVNESIKSQHEITSAFKERQNQRPQSEEPKKVKKLGLFRKKKVFSIKSSALAGAQIGAGVGTLAASSNMLTKKIVKSGPIFKPVQGDPKKVGFEQRMALVAAGTIIGAALGALVGVIGEIDKKISRKSINDRLMPSIISNLKKDNLREGSDYTRDPNVADRLQTRVCLAVSRNSGDLRVLINTKSDPKLKKITDQIVKNIPNTGVKNTTANNKFNEITISTISDSSADATLVSGIAEQFIHSGFPVYLVEVG